jgi:hypothetical protein
LIFFIRTPNFRAVEKRVEVPKHENVIEIA